MWKLERLASKGFWPEETRDPRVRRSTGRGRGCGWSFMQRIGLVEVGSEAGVEQRRAVQRRAWFHRRLGSSRLGQSDRWMVMLAEQPSSLSCRGVESTAATE